MIRTRPHGPTAVSQRARRSIGRAARCAPGGPAAILARRGLPLAAVVVTVLFWGAARGQGFDDPDRLEPYTSIPVRPTERRVDVRPEQWPGGASPSVAHPRGGPSADPRMGSVAVERSPTAREAPAQEIAGAAIVARIGGDVILAGEVLGNVNETLARNAEKIPRQQLEEYREALFRQTLMGLLERKLVFTDAKRKIPAENLPKIQAEVEEQFDRHEIKRLYEHYEVDSRARLDQVLRRYGTSVDREKQAFVEQRIAQQWVSMQIKTDKEITRDQQLAYYQSHRAEYEYPDQVQWEELTVRLGGSIDRRQAWSKLAWMGNQVLGGAPLAEIAKAHSEGPEAVDGGVHGWTTRGSLRATILDEALFTLPVGQLSPILESEQGLHIVRVTARKLAGRTPFEEVQGEIREKIRIERFKAATREYITRLHEQIPIWTIYDETDGSVPAGPSQAAGRRARPSAVR